MTPMKEMSGVVLRISARIGRSVEWPWVIEITWLRGVMSPIASVCVETGWMVRFSCEGFFESQSGRLSMRSILQGRVARTGRSLPGRRGRSRRWRCARQARRGGVRT